MPSCSHWAITEREFTPARQISKNGLDLDSFTDLVYVSLVAFLLAWVIVVTGRVVRLHGIERFFGDEA